MHQMSGKYIIFFLILTIKAATQQIKKKPIFIEYGYSNENFYLHKLVSDIHNGLFVEIGAYDPIFVSNTLNLRVQGWNGISVEASLERAKYLFPLRPDQINLNIAVGDQGTFMTFYEFEEEQASTLSKNSTQNYLKLKNKRKKSQYSVISISLKQLCQRYFYQKPIFINLDIQGYGTAALLSNDWKNQKCRPDIIFSENNYMNQNSGLDPPSSVLLANGYKLFDDGVLGNQYYVEQKKFDYYKKKLIQANEFFKNFYHVLSTQIFPALARMIGQKTNINPHYNIATDPIFYHFTKYKQIVNIKEINDRSNFYSKKKNRPIMVLHFDPLLSSIIVPTSKYRMDSVHSNQYKLTKLVVQLAEQLSISVYILDHRFYDDNKCLSIIVQDDYYWYQSQATSNSAQNVAISYIGKLTFINLLGSLILLIMIGSVAFKYIKTTKNQNQIK